MKIKFLLVAMFFSAVVVSSAMAEGEPRLQRVLSQEKLPVAEKAVEPFHELGIMAVDIRNQIEEFQRNRAA